MAQIALNSVESLAIQRLRRTSKWKTGTKTPHQPHFVIQESVDYQRVIMSHLAFHVPVSNYLCYLISFKKSDTAIDSWIF